MKIFQAYYKPEQISHLDSEFTPFDNTANPVINFHEYYIYKRIYEQAQLTNEDLWGHFSWQWKRKLESVKAHQIIDIINSNPGADVYTFHPYPWECATAWNVWEQGQWCHPNILMLAERILMDMNIPIRVLHRPMGSRDYLCCNYFVGNKKFWDQLLAFLDLFVDRCENLSGSYLTMLNESAGYEENPNLNYRGFLCERMISTFLVLNPDILVRPFIEAYQAKISEDMRKLVSLKDKGIDFKDRSFLLQYVEQRTQGKEGYNWANWWVNTCEL
jgi:hypothetical protein